MEARRDRRSLRPVDAASRAVVVPGEGATGAHFVAPGGAPTAEAPLFAGRGAPTLALFSAQRRAVDSDAERVRALALGDRQPPAAKAPWKDHDLCNPAPSSTASAATSIGRHLCRIGDATPTFFATHFARSAASASKGAADDGSRPRWRLCEARTTRPRASSAFALISADCLRCGSVWECPVCAMQIRAERAREVEAVVIRWSIERVAMLSLTVRHGLGHDLRTVREGITNAFRKLTRGDPWARFKAKYGLRHFIRAMGVTHGPNGWHPHLHIQLFLAAALDKEQLEAAQAWLRDRWFVSVLGVLGADHAPDSEHGVNLTPTKRGDYAFKIALELVEPGTKRARTGNRTPWQIAADFEAFGRESDAALWTNYCAGMRGAQMQHWSRGLRDAVALGAEATEQEIVNGEHMPGEEIVAVLEPSACALLIARGAAAFLAVLEAAEMSATAADCDRAIRQIVRGPPCCSWRWPTEHQSCLIAWSASREWPSANRLGTALRWVYRRIGMTVLV
jgi:hypothetical protein